MKFSMNGAPTIGTLDGANVEIRQAVGEENFFLFGLTAEEVRQRQAEGYHPWSFYDQNPELRSVIDRINSGLFSHGDTELFRPITDNLLHDDPFMVLADSAPYVERQGDVDQAWRDPALWNRFCSDSTLSSRVKAVRQAIGDSGGEQKWIQTVHGRGFRFIGTVRVVSSTGDLSAATEDRRTRDDTAELRQEVRDCRTRDGVRIAFARVGEAPGLVKAANWMSQLEYDWESPIGRHWIAGLARNHALIRYDERGNGLSDRELADTYHPACLCRPSSVLRSTVPSFDYAPVVAS